MWSWPKRLSSDDKLLEKLLWWLCFCIVIVALLPSVFILLWGIYVYSNINHLLGFAIFLVLMAVQLGSYAFFHWKVNGWRIDRLVYILFTIAVLLMWTFELWTIYLQEPYTYFMLSVVYVSFNFLPMCFLTYLVARGMTKSLAEYELLGNDPVVDYLAYIAELKEAQKIKVGTQDKIALRSSGEGGPSVGGSASSGSVGSPASIGASSGGAVRIHLQQDEEKKDQQQQQQSGVISVQPNSAAVADSNNSKPVERGTGIRVSIARLRSIRFSHTHSHSVMHTHLVSTSFPLAFGRIVERPLKTRRSLYRALARCSSRPVAFVILLLLLLSSLSLTLSPSCCAPCLRSRRAS